MDPITEQSANQPAAATQTQAAASGAAQAAEPAKSAVPEGVEVVVNGETRKLSIEEAKSYAQRFLGSEDKFRAAAELRKEASPALEFKEAFSRLKNNTSGANVEQDIYTVSEYLGIEPDSILSELNQTSPKGNTRMTTQNNQPAASNLQGPITFDQLPEEVREAVVSSKSRDLEQTRNNIESDLKNSIDSDPELSKVVNEIESSSVMSPAELKEFKQSLFDIALGDVKNQLFTSNQDYGPDMRLRVIQKLRSKANSLGISKLGRVGGNSLPAAMGITDTTLLANLGNSQPPAREKATSNEYADNFVKRFAFAAGKAARNPQKD